MRSAREERGDRWLGEQAGCEGRAAPAHVEVQPGCMGLRPGCMRLQPGCMRLQPGCIGLQPSVRVHG